jgi:CP family cyanate transporter-like MFS transporter
MPASATPAAPSSRGTGRWPGGPLFATGVALLGFNLRTGVTSLPPVFSDLESRLRLSALEISALAAAPVLCFSVFSPLAAPLSRRFGEERVLLAASVLLAGGLLLRAAAPAWLLFPGTLAAGAAVAAMNVLLPSLIRRRCPAQAGLLIGIYLLTLSAGAVLGSLAAVPLLRASGGSVPVTLGVWALPALAAALAWLPQRRFRSAPEPPAGDPLARPGRARLSRHLLAWQVLGFMGLQSLTYYAALSWLPALFRDRGTGAVTAGALLGLMNLGNAGTSLVLPVLAHRARDQRALAAAVVACSAAGLAGAWFAPLAGAAGWTLLLGLGQGGALGLAIYLTTARAPDPATAASLSAFAQGGGYLVATAGPLLVGFLHTASRGWTVPVGALLVIFAGEFLAGWQAARARVLPASG